MKFSKTNANLLIPDSLSEPEALSRTTHLGVGAHQDDLEFMALHGILECFQSNEKWFGGVTCTDGAGSSRTGAYADFTDDDMKAVRVREQHKAAMIGEYSFIAQLDHTSANSKISAQRGPLVDDLEAILRATQPEFVYTHNPFDKHASHVGVFFALLEAMRRLSAEERPKKVFGCEVWRCLDWLPDRLKVFHSLGDHPNLSASLNGVFDSQIAGGKRYDLAVEGRRLANATFLDPHASDEISSMAYAVDLTPLAHDPSLTVEDYMGDILGAFVCEVTELVQDTQ